MSWSPRILLELSSQLKFMQAKRMVVRTIFFLSLSQDMAAKLINRRHNVTINVFDVVLRNLSFGIVKSGLKKGIVVNDSHKRLGDTKRFRR